MRMTFEQIRELWLVNYGAPEWADTMAAIALAESGGRTDAHNATPPDDSYGLWQINYLGKLNAPRTERYGTPEQLLADPDRQARAAIDISSNGRNLRPWSTFTNGAYRRHLPIGYSAMTPDPALKGEPVSTPTPLHPLVAIAAAPDGDGYWILAADGAVFAFGSAEYKGGLELDQSGNWRERQ